MRPNVLMLHPLPPPLFPGRATHLSQSHHQYLPPRTPHPVFHTTCTPISTYHPPKQKKTINIPPHLSPTNCHAFPSPVPALQRAEKRRTPSPPGSIGIGAVRADDDVSAMRLRYLQPGGWLGGGARDGDQRERGGGA